MGALLFLLASGWEFPLVSTGAMAPDEDYRQKAHLAAQAGVDRLLTLAAAGINQAGQALGPVDEDSRVKQATIRQEGNQITLRAQGMAGDARRDGWVTMRWEVADILSAQGPGVKLLSPDDLVIREGAHVEADVFSAGSVYLDPHIRGQVGTDENPRSLRSLGSVLGAVEAVVGWVTASGSITPGVATMEAAAGWEPGGALPDLGDVGFVLSRARQQALALESLTGRKHHFSQDLVLAAEELAGLEGVVLVDGNLTLAGGETSSPLFLGATGHIDVQGDLAGERLALVAGGNLVLPGQGIQESAALVAGADLGWGGETPASSLIVRTGYAVARTLNGNLVVGPVIIEDREVPAWELPGPMRQLMVLDRGTE